MERKHNGSPGLTPRRAGLGADFERVRTGTTATAEELREFMQNFRGKNPQEVLGLVAKSGLIQGVGISLLGTLVVMFTLTVVPYVWSGESPKKAGKSTAAKSSEKPAAKAVAASPAASPGAAAAPAQSATGAAANAQQTLEKLGESETKTADPAKNPLDNLDNLLDDTK